MTDLRSPERAESDALIREDELVPADDTIIGRAFAWSLAVFAVIGAIVGATVWLLSRAPVVTPASPSAFVPPRALVIGAATIPSIAFADVTLEAGIDFVRENG